MSVKVRLINTTSESPDKDLMIADHTTFQEFLDENDINRNSSSIRVRKNGEVVQLNLEDHMETGMKVTVTPTSIKGA